MKERLQPLVEARARLLADIAPVAEVETLPLSSAAGRVLADALASPAPFPAFDHAAMDGWAVALPGDGFRIVGRSAAGDAEGAPLAPGEARRIFTGAPLPAGAAAVVMQEDARAEGGLLRLAAPPRAGQHIRRAGEDVALGARLLAPGLRMDARRIALLAAVGVEAVPVRRRVRVAIASTGNEIGAPAPGRGIRDANRPMLAALLAAPSIELSDLGVVGDDRDRLAETVAAAARRFDLLVTTGGTSVGEEDHLGRAVEAAGGSITVARLAVKPGKPALFGSVGGLRVAGLPGNPFAALVAGLLLARPLAWALAGLGAAPLSPAAAVSGFVQPRSRDRVELLPVCVAGLDDAGRPILARVGPTGAARLGPLGQSDGLAWIDPGPAALALGDRVGFLPFEAAFGL